VSSCGTGGQARADLQPCPLRAHAPQVDGTRNRVLLMRFGVEAYPSIFLLREGRTWQYEEGRSAGQVRRGGRGAAPRRAG
jgi:hypothetical protein